MIIFMHWWSQYVNSSRSLKKYTAKIKSLLGRIRPCKSGGVYNVIHNKYSINHLYARRAMVSTLSFLFGYDRPLLRLGLNNHLIFSTIVFSWRYYQTREPTLSLFWSHGCCWPNGLIQIQVFFRWSCMAIA